MESLALEIEAGERGRAMEVVLRAIAKGASWLEVEAAIHLVANRAVHSNPPGMLSHVILETESILQLVEGAPEDVRAHAALYHVDDVKFAQARVREGWTLGAAPGVTHKTGIAAHGALIDALAAFDGEAADRAMTDLVRHGASAQGLDACIERVLGDLGGLGHKAIHAVHTLRCLPRLGAVVELDALRSLAIGVASFSPAGERADAGPSRALADDQRAGWEDGEARPKESAALAALLLEATAEEARDAVAKGANAATSWDAIRLAAADLYARRPSLLPVHAVTIENSVGFLGRHSTSEHRRRTALFVGASWIPRLRDRLVEEERTPRNETVLDVLTASSKEAVDVERVLAEPTFEHVRDHVNARGVDAFTKDLVPLLFRGVEQNHQVKYAACSIEDARLAHPRWRGALLASVFGYLPRSASDPAASFVRAEALLAARD